MNFTVVVFFSFFCEERHSACVVFSNNGEYFGLDNIPLQFIFFGNRDKIVSVENSRDTSDLEELGCKW